MQEGQTVPKGLPFALAPALFVVDQAIVSAREAVSADDRGFLDARATPFVQNANFAAWRLSQSLVHRPTALDLAAALGQPALHPTVRRMGTTGRLNPRWVSSTSMRGQEDVVLDEPLYASLVGGADELSFRPSPEPIESDAQASAPDAALAAAWYDAIEQWSFLRLEINDLRRRVQRNRRLRERNLPFLDPVADLPAWVKWRDDLKMAVKAARERSAQRWSRHVSHIRNSAP